jgi:hypothetical protein
MRYLVERCRCDEAKAEDLFQGFVLEIVLKKRLISQAKPERGHQFRSFVLRALSNYVVSQFRKEQSQRRHPEAGLESLDQLLEQGELSLTDAWAPSFDLAWAKSVVLDAMNRMEADCLQNGQQAIWGVFQGRLKQPILEGAPVIPYEQLVERFGFTSPIQAQNSLATAKRKFARSLREIVKEYTPDDTAAEVELRELQLILANSPRA